MSNETQKNFPALLEQFKGEVARALPKHLNPDRMSRIALTAFRRTPKLGDCDPRSVFAAVIQASQLGLEPDTLGRSYLIPYGRECQFVPGWKGLVDLTNRAGNATVWTGAVFQGDEFDYSLGDRPFISHKPCGEDDPKALTHVYAVGRVRGAEWPNIEVWPIGRVMRHRDRYNKVGRRHYSFEHVEMYARKVVLLQVLKYMPASAEMAQAIALNDAAEIGKQGLNIKDAIDGTWVPVDDDEPPARGEDALTGMSDTDFQKQLPTWHKLIAEKKKTADQIIAMVSSKNALSEDQKKAIREAPADKPKQGTSGKVTAEQIAQIKESAEAGAISTADITSRFGIKRLEDLAADQVPAVLAFINDPTGE